MKKMLMIAGALIATLNAVAANASGTHDSWANIFADDSLLVSTPYSGTFGPMGIFNACATETEFKSISPVKVCVKSVYIPGTGELYPGHYDCLKYESQITAMPRTSTDRICVAQDTSEANYPACLQWTNVTTTLPTQMKIDVMYRNGDGYGTTAFTKEFTVPHCAQ